MKSKYTQVNFRLTEKERDNWQEYADNQNMTLPKFSKYLINLFLETGKIKQPKINKNQGANINKDLGRLGGNVNQIAKWCNQNKNNISEENIKDLNRNLSCVKEELAKIWQQLN